MAPKVGRYIFTSVFTAFQFPERPSTKQLPGEYQAQALKRKTRFSPNSLKKPSQNRRKSVSRGCFLYLFWNHFGLILEAFLGTRFETPFWPLFDSLVDRNNRFWDPTWAQEGGPDRSKSEEKSIRNLAIFLICFRMRFTGAGEPKLQKNRCRNDSKTVQNRS